MKKLIETQKIIIALFIGVVFGLVANVAFVSAYEIQDIEETPIRNDFVLGPGKTDLNLDPGSEIVKNLMITNRLGREMNFKIDIEDFTGSDDPEKTVVLLGSEKGPYSLKDYLKPEITEFALQHGQRIILPVRIQIPEDAEPGGLYGSVLVSTDPPETEPERSKGQTRIISRLGMLFLIRVNGEITEDGFLHEFKISEPQKLFYEKGPIPFELLFQNNGNVHLSPYGKIEIINLMGKKVGELEVDPYFAMPDSLRKREIQWGREQLFGRYTATLFLNRNYVGEENIIDQKTITFWAFPWKMMLVVIIGIVFLILLIRWFFRKFKFELKKKEDAIEDIGTQETNIQ